MGAVGRASDGVGGAELSSVPPPHPYAGQPVVLATQHHKDSVIAPALAHTPGLLVHVPDGLDTDQLGTFTGEIERPAPAAQTALLKARLGMEASGLPRAVASEGSFGPHPEAPILACGLEILAFVDDTLAIEVVVTSGYHPTNFMHTTTAGLDEETERFLTRAEFPSHAVIVRPHVGPVFVPLVKGVTNRRDLLAAIRRCAAASEDGKALLQTDMRAHVNPTRMRHISGLAGQLAERLTALCPVCAAPGYGIVEVERGLPCASCARPTDWVAVQIHGCARCPSRSRRPREDRLDGADPGHCHYCNP